MMEFTSTWLLGKGPLPRRLTLCVFAGFAWAVWTTRNKMAIEKFFPKPPTDVIYLALSFMQKWSILLKEEDREQICQLKAVIMNWLEFKPSNQLLLIRCLRAVVVSLEWLMLVLNCILFSSFVENLLSVAGNHSITLYLFLS